MNTVTQVLMVHFLENSSISHSHKFFYNNTEIEFDKDVSRNYLQVYTIRDNSHVDVYTDISRNIEIAEWFTISLSGSLLENTNNYPIHRGHVLNNYTDASVNIGYILPNGTYTLENTISNSIETNTLFSYAEPELGRYLQRYALTDNSHVDVYLDISKNILVRDWLEPVIQGSNPYKVQVKYSPYLDRGVDFSASGLGDNSYNFSVKTRYDKEGITTLDVSQNYIETYDICSNYYPDVIEEVSRVIMVQNWISLSLSGDATHFVQVDNSYTDSEVIVTNDADDLLFDGSSQNLPNDNITPVHLSAITDDPSYQIIKTFQRVNDPYGNIVYDGLKNNFTTDICGTYIQHYRYSDYRNPELDIDITRDLSVNEWIGTLGDFRRQVSLPQAPVPHVDLAIKDIYFDPTPSSDPSGVRITNSISGDFTKNTR